MAGALATEDPEPDDEPDAPAATPHSKPDISQGWLDLNVMLSMGDLFSQGR